MSGTAISSSSRKSFYSTLTLEIRETILSAASPASITDFDPSWSSKAHSSEHSLVNFYNIFGMRVEELQQYLKQYVKNSMNFKERDPYRFRFMLNNMTDLMLVEGDVLSLFAQDLGEGKFELRQPQQTLSFIKVSRRNGEEQLLGAITLDLKISLMEKIKSSPFCFLKEYAPLQSFNAGVSVDTFKKEVNNALGRPEDTLFDSEVIDYSDPEKPLLSFLSFYGGKRALSLVAEGPLAAAEATVPCDF